MAKEIKNIVIMSGDSTYNRGDRANLFAQINGLKKSFPQANIYFDSYRPEVDSVWYEAKAVSQGLFLTLNFLKALIKADVVIWGGGSLIEDTASRVKVAYWFVKIWVVKFILRKKIYAWALGIVIRKKPSRFFSRRIFNMVDYISVRDENSRMQLKELNLNKAVHLVADSAVLFPRSDKSLSQKILKSENIRFDEKTEYLGLANTFCAFHYRENVFIPYKLRVKFGLENNFNNPNYLQALDYFHNLIEAILKNTGYHIVIFPTYPAPWETDNEAFKKILGQLPDELSKRVQIISKDEYSPQEYFSLYDYLKIVISSPMHHSIVAAIYNKPCINLSYQTKCVEFYKRLGVRGLQKDIFYLMKNNDTRAVLNLIRQIEGNYENYVKKINLGMQEIKDLGMLNFQLFKGFTEKL